MRYIPSVAPRATRDIEEVFDWYNSEQEGLGNRFESEFYESVARICEAPRSYSPFYRKARRMRMSDFPYYIYFQLNQNNVAVFAVVHTSRSDEQWKSRLRK